MEVHTWKERTEEGTLVYRACHHAGKWKLECAPKVGRAERDDVEWEHVELTRAHWVTLRDVLWRKYQRKRCPWRFIETIDKLLEEMPGMAFLGVSFCLRVMRPRRPGWLPCLPGLPRKFRACRASLLCRLRGTGGGFLHPVRIMPPLRGGSPLF